MTFFPIISIVILIGLIAIPLVPPLLVLRGQRFWAPWTMIAALGVVVLTVGGNLAGQFYLGRRMEEVIATGGTAVYESPEWTRLMDLMQLFAMIGGGLVALAFLLYGTGLLGVAVRWKETSRRAKELEAKTTELAARREAGGS